MINVRESDEIESVDNRYNHNTNQDIKKYMIKGKFFQITLIYMI